MKIGNVRLHSEYVLAPMAGFTEVGFRKVCAMAGVGLTTTEMVSAKGLVYGSENTEELLRTVPEESTKAVQLFSNEPAVLADAVQHPDIAKFDIIDINMGCPVPKIVKNGMGSALLREPKLAGELVSSCVKSTTKPVTVKIRIGIDGMQGNIIDFVKLMQGSGASAITVHGRTREQMYAGKANWDIISNIADALDIPVFGNGDIDSAESARLHKEKYGCQGIAIGRGALGNPWIFADLSGTTFDVSPLDVITIHINTLLKYYRPEIVFPAMRKHFSYYIRYKRNSKVLRDRINRATDYNEIMQILTEVFS